MEFQFDPLLLDTSIEAPVQGYKVLPLNTEASRQGYFSLLRQLTVAPEPSTEEFLKRFKFLQERKEEYKSIIILEESTQKIVGSGTLLLEYKFVRGFGLVGHIEDIVVCESCRGKRLGKFIIEHLKALAKKQGAYKVLLACNEGNVQFYEKCGLVPKEVSMACYF